LGDVVGFCDQLALLVSGIKGEFQREVQARDLFLFWGIETEGKLPLQLTFSLVLVFRSPVANLIWLLELRLPLIMLRAHVAYCWKGISRMRLTLQGISPISKSWVGRVLCILVLYSSFVIAAVAQANIKDLSQHGAVAGGPSVTVTVLGQGLTSTNPSSVCWGPDGISGCTSELAMTLVSSTTATVTIPATLLSQPGLFWIQFSSISPPGVLAIPFRVTKPTIDSISPAQVMAGASAFILTINGSGFITGGGWFGGFPLAAITTVLWNGVPLTTTVPAQTDTIFPNQLQAAVPAGLIAQAGQATITLSTTGNVSGSATVSINPGSVPSPPTVTTLSPGSATAGSSGIELTVNGSNFVSGSVVRWIDSDRLTTFISSTQLRASIPASDLTVMGIASVTVFSPSGGGLSNGKIFFINHPTPTITSLNPSTVIAGTTPGGFGLTVEGSNFVNTSVIQVNGSAVTTTYVSGARLTGAIPIGLASSGRTYSVTVYSPDAGGGRTSNASSYVVAYPGPTISSINPARIAAGSGAFTLTVIGTGFFPDDGFGYTTVRWNGTPLATTFVSSTQLTATVPASYVVGSGIANISVFTPSPGGGSSTNQTFTVNDSDTVPPIVTMTEPGNGSTVTGVITVSGSATDNVGVIGVQFLLDGTPIGTEDLSAPYSTTLDTAPLSGGNHTLSARARDAAGNIGTAAAVTVSKSAGTGGLSAIEREALIALYTSTNGANWTNRGGWLGAAGSECSWFGVTCANSNRLTAVSLSSNNLVGTLPLELRNMTNLQSLFLSYNQLGGSIPAELGNLTNLIDLRLDGNALSGSIPPELGNLTNLQVLFLDFNRLSGNIPARLGNLANLLSLSLSGNQLGGIIPAELGNLTNLEVLNLSRNLLSGSIPARLGDLTNLLFLDLGTGSHIVDGIHQLTGSTQPGNQANLQEFALPTNKLGGSIPPELGKLTNLQTLRLDSNQLNGSIPRELGNLTKLQTVDLSANQLSGSPIVLGDLTNLQELYVESNQLSGSIPAQLGNLTNLQILSLAWNALFATDSALRTFLNSKAGSWENTQTVAPSNLSATALTPSSIQVTWQTIPYTSDAGGYRVRYSTTPGGSNTLFGTTPNKAASSLTVTGLNPATTYYFVIETVTSPHSNNQNQVVSQASNEVTATTPPRSGVVDTVPPVVTITSPSDGSTVTGVITVSASATDNVGVIGVQFLLDGTPIGAEDLSAPYSTTLDTAPLGAGNHALSARARDADGNTGTAADVTVSKQAAPTISSLSPNTTTAGGIGLTLTVNGTRFGSGAVVQWNGTPLATTFVSTTQLTASVPASLIANPTTIQVTVAAGGVTSNSATFSVIAGPTISSLNPSTMTAGAAAFSLTVNGTGFASISTVRWNGASLPTTFVSATQLTASVAASLVAMADTATVTVVSGTLASNGVSFSITAPIDTSPPTVTITSPINGSTVTGVITVLATATDNVGIVGVQFLVDGTTFGEVTTAPYRVTIDTPLTSGTHTLSATARDAAGNRSTGTVTISFQSVSLTITNLPQGPVRGAEQPKPKVTASAPISAEISGKMELSFTHNADSAMDRNPEVVFSTGSATIDFTIPANGSEAVFGGNAEDPCLKASGFKEACFQSGTVAGTVRLNVTLQKGAASVTSTSRTVTVDRIPPVVSDVKLNRTSGGLEVVIMGYSTPRSLRSASFTFSAKAGATLTNATHTLTLDAAAATWYDSDPGKGQGSQFRMAVPFTFSGDVNALGSVSVILTNGSGTSEARSGNLP
jgi:Leucine-rich repeat (LRR) protein